MTILFQLLQFSGFSSNKRCGTVSEEVGWFNSKEGGACDNIVPASSIFLYSRWHGLDRLKEGRSQ